jgi:hypothetical protein
MTAYAKDMRGVKQLLNLAVSEQKRFNDTAYLIAGKEGSGKSNFMLNCVQYIDELKQTQTPIISITRNLRELIKTLKITEDKEQIALDEGSELSSDLHYEAIMKGVRKMFVVMREKSLIIYICFTNPSKINSYFRDDRIKGVFVIVKRGLVYYYTRSQFAQILEYLKKYKGDIKSIDNVTRTPIKPALIDTFPKYEGELLEEYKKRKTENIKNIFDELYDDFGEEEKIYSLRKGAKFIGIGLTQFASFVKTEANPDGIIPSEYSISGNSLKIKEGELIKFRQWYINNHTRSRKNTKDN